MNTALIKQAAFEHTLAQYGLLEKDADFRSFLGGARNTVTRAMGRARDVLTNTPRAVTSPGVTRPMGAIAHTPPSAPATRAPVATPTALVQTQQAAYPPQSVFDQLRQSKPLPPTLTREQHPHLFAQNPQVIQSPAPQPRYSREEQIQMARGVPALVTPKQYGEMMAAQTGESALKHRLQYRSMFGGGRKLAHYLLKTAQRRHGQKKVAHYRLRSAA